ncbi:MAG: hypothetical protein RLN89_14390 [Parvibaculum sp.]
MLSLANLPDRFLLSWDQRFVRKLGGRPGIAAFVVAALVFGSFCFLASITGIYEIMGQGDLPETAYTLGLDPYTWAALISSLLTGFGVSAASFALVHDVQDMEEAAPVLGYEADEMITDWLAYLRDAEPLARVITFGFFVIGFLIAVTNVPGAQDWLRPEADRIFPWFQQVPALWFLIVIPFNFALIGKGAYFTLVEGRFRRRIRTERLAINLFHLDELAPFTRMALRRSFLWIIGSSICLLFFLNEAVHPSGLLPFILAIMIVAVVTLVAPLVSIHRKISVEKVEELRRVRDQLHVHKSELMEGGVGANDAARRLSGLVAYEARVERVSEWPLDMPTLGRFSFYLAIPLFSWVGGALVERVVDFLI